MWRLLLIISMLLGGGLTAPLATAQDVPEAPTDLAAMLVPPSDLPEPGYQFARGGYLTPDDARYLLERRYPLDADALDSVFDSAGWRQVYTGTLVLLSDRAYLLSDPLVTVTTTIHELDDDDGATLAEALLTGTPPDGAEDRDAAFDGATTWRVVSSQDDSLVTVARSGRFLVEVETAGRRRTPADAEHVAVVRETLDRVDAADSAGNPGLSQQLVPLADARLIPVSVATEYPLAHTWYRLIDGEVIPAAGELNPLASSDLGVAIDEIAITRQTAELASQNWVTAGIVVARFGSPADAEAFDGVLRDPLDFFPVSEEVANVDPATITGQVEAISGETRVGGRYSGFRITIVEGDTVAQLTIRAMGSILIGQDGAEAWAERQRACLAGVPCEAIALDTLLATRDAASPVAQGVDDDVYRSPVAPWSVAFDPTTWQVDDAFAQGGYDYLYLRADSVDVTFETIVDHRGDPEQCILDELDRLREDEDRARISVGSDDPDEPPGGLNDGHGWIVYTVEPLEDARADQEYVIRIDCYTVVAGSTSLVVQARAPRDQWSRLAPVAGELRSRIEIEGVPMGRATGDLPGAAPTTRSDVMINRRPWVGNAA